MIRHVCTVYGLLLLMHEELSLSNKYPGQIQIGQRAMEGRKADA